MKYLLVITEDGYGKRTPLTAIPHQQRGGKGVKVTSRPPLAAALTVDPGDQIMVVTRTGKFLRLAVAEIPDQNRSTRGSRLVTLATGDSVTTATKVPREGVQIDPNAVSGRP